MKKYALEIYVPGSIETVVQVFESEDSFQTISEGDLLNPHTWEIPDYQGSILRVVNIEHFIWEIDGTVEHKIGVMTEEVGDTHEQRFS
jgi:hypothetical protein